MDPQSFERVLEGHVPDGSGRRLGKRGRDGSIHHRPDRDVTLSAQSSLGDAGAAGEESLQGLAVDARYIRKRLYRRCGGRQSEISARRVENASMTSLEKPAISNHPSAWLFWMP